MSTYFCALAIIFSTFSCNSDTSTKANGEFLRSLGTWNSLKIEFGNSYQFGLQSDSVFGFGSVISITVIDGIIVSRVYEVYQLNAETQERTIT